jgi:hypothetical protein
VVAASIQGKSGHGLYRYGEGKLTPLAVTGQEMPGGGRLADVEVPGGSFSWANEAGQHAFVARLSDGTRAAYLLGEDGALSRIVKSNEATDVGTITQLTPAGSAGIALNSKGQVALPVRIEGGPTAIVLLTPVAE